MYLLLIFFVYVYIEISIFVAIANTIGVFLALICVITTSIIGLSIIKSQGLKNFTLLQKKMSNNENPTNELIKNVSLLIAGFLFLIPGFLTDFLGIMLLLPFVQHYIIKKIIPKINIKTFNNYSRKESYDESHIIEGEFKRKNDE